MSRCHFWCIAACAALCFTGCARPAAPRTHVTASSCIDRATDVIAHNLQAISARRFAAASAAMENAARMTLACSAQTPNLAQRFQERWRAANALVVSAELAHEAHQHTRAQQLLAEGYDIMRSLHPPARTGTMTASLFSQKLVGARRDLRGDWTYW